MPGPGGLALAVSDAGWLKLLGADWADWPELAGADWLELAG